MNLVALPEAVSAVAAAALGCRFATAFRAVAHVGRVAAGECAFPTQARPVLGGATFCVDIIDVMTFDDTGAITTMRAFWDPAEMRPAED